MVDGLIGSRLCGEIKGASLAKSRVELMYETWLRPNRRAIWFGCAPPLVLSAIGAWLTVVANSNDRVWLRWIGMALVMLGTSMIIALLHQMRRPRIAFQDGQVLFYLRTGAPIAVPAHIVEAFFVGQGPATIPGNRQHRQQCANLVARLSQREADWAQRDVKPALGQWCGGYVTISGTWCEPLDSELIRRLNRRLKEVNSVNKA
jgi:hypothetical protein